MSVCVRPEQHIEGDCVYCERDDLQARIARVERLRDDMATSGDPYAVIGAANITRALGGRA